MSAGAAPAPSTKEVAALTSRIFNGSVQQVIPSVFGEQGAGGGLFAFTRAVSQCQVPRQFGVQVRKHQRGVGAHFD